METDPLTRWHPIASESDIPFRHVFHGKLMGRELAVWRADDGFVNVWENRCLHRGVRLSIGINDGAELSCQYHGWRYANRTAGCTYIPAHPADAPARTICNRTFPAVERYGLVWSGENPVGEPPEVAAFANATTTVLRNLPVHAPAAMVAERLTEYRFPPNDRIGAEDVEITSSRLDEYSVSVTATADGSSTTVLFFVQPVDSAQSVIRGVMSESPVSADRVTILRHHNTLLSTLRDDIESAAQLLPPPEPMVPLIERISPELAEIPETPRGRQASLRVTVARKWPTAEAITALELEPLNGRLPTFQPGAHIDVHLPNGLVRQYSITNGPGESTCYRIGVKLEPESQGGSRCLHETVREGDVLAISEPRNNFPLRRDSVHTIFLAGGIGITPLLSMAQTLQRGGLAFELHCFVQGDRHLAFPEILAELGTSVRHHVGLSPDETVAELTKLLAFPAHAHCVYVCGPGPMLEAARKIAGESGWPDAAVHFEYFQNTNEIDDSSTFDVALARSALTLHVPAGQTILEVVRANGIDVPSSCEQGACGTCGVDVIEGEPDHQDVYLNDSEKQAGTRIMTCISRAKSDRLVLDL